MGDLVSENEVPDWSLFKHLRIIGGTDPIGCSQATSIPILIVPYGLVEFVPLLS